MKLSDIITMHTTKKNFIPLNKVTATRKRAHANDFDECFSLHEESNISYCNNIIYHTIIPNNWSATRSN